MALVGYSEFSFGYAFTENMIRSAALTPIGAPVFPNLVQEAVLGYDVRIDLPGVPLFFQYKLPAIMTTTRAIEIKKYNLPLHPPFFRIQLMRRDHSDQHSHLIDLENNYPNRVYYASSCCQNNWQFNAAYNAANVYKNAALFSPQDIGPLPDDLVHTISYTEHSVDAYFRSEPKLISKKTFSEISKGLEDQFHQQRFSNLREVAKEIRDKVRTAVPASIRSSEGAIDQRIRSTVSPIVGPADFAEKRETIHDLLVGREMARVGLSLDLVVAQPKS